MEQSIYLRSEKINAILHDHPEMTVEEIKRIPEILDDPVLVMKSRNKARSQYGNSRLVMFGSVKAKDGRPIMCVMDLRPTENGFLLDDMQKVTSAYTKDNDPVWYVENSDILHLDKKRTIPLLRGMGFQMPMSLLQSGSVGSISYEGKRVKLQGVPFAEVVKENVTRRLKRNGMSYEQINEITSKYKENIKMHERMSDVFAGAMGNEFFIAKFEDFDEMQSFRTIVLEKK